MQIEKIHFKDYLQENHWYSKVLNVQINPLVSSFFNMKNEAVIARYTHLNPNVKKGFLEKILHNKPKHFFWSGGDLINVTSSSGKRQMVIIETNSCPSGNKSTPLLNDHDDFGGYGRLAAGGIKQFIKGKRMISGVLAVIYDKNHMENWGYAHAISKEFDESVYMTTYNNGENNSHIKIEDGIIYLNIEDKWAPVRFAFRYVTQKPWNRIPVDMKTLIFNPVISCLAGGRNKAVAARAYELFNSELNKENLHINIPETFWNISMAEIPFWYEKFGGHIVIKVPYSNAGQGVFLITNHKELDKFMQTEFIYDKFIVQSLIGNFKWSSKTDNRELYHVGTLPDKNNNIYVADIRMMINYTEEGFRPLGIYSRRSAKPLTEQLDENVNTWDILGTNISIKKGENKWEYDEKRLIVMDRKDFNKLGLGIDDLIEGFMQTVFTTLAIDKMADTLINNSGKFKRKLFASYNPDEKLLDEILK